MSLRQLTVTGWALFTEGLDDEGIEKLEDELNAPRPGSLEAKRERAALVASLKGR